MRADKLPEYSIMVRLWRVPPIFITVQHLGNDNLFSIKTLVKNTGDNWGAGILEAKRILPCNVLQMRVFHNISLFAVYINRRLNHSQKTTLNIPSSPFKCTSKHLDCYRNSYLETKRPAHLMNSVQVYINLESLIVGCNGT